MVCPVVMNKINQQIQENNHPCVILHVAFTMPAKVLVVAAE